MLRSLLLAAAAAVVTLFAISWLFVDILSSPPVLETAIHWIAMDSLLQWNSLLLRSPAAAAAATSSREERFSYPSLPFPFLSLPFLSFLVLFEEWSMIVVVVVVVVSVVVKF